jgi:poly(3-hydroxybutyrate) depolymerase
MLGAQAADGAHRGAPSRRIALPESRGSAMPARLLPLVAALLAMSPHLAPAVPGALASSSPEPRLVVAVRIAEVPRPDDRALEADVLERALAAGAWQPPADDGPDALGLVWRTATADSAGWIDDPALRGGYAVATVTMPRDTTLILEGMGYRAVRVGEAWREGNLYGGTDEFAPWQPRFDFARVPVRLPAGQTTLVFAGNRFGRLRARLWPVTAPLSFNARDVTLPDLVAGEPVATVGAIVVLNATDETITDARLTARLGSGEATTVDVPALPPYGVRKVGFAVRGPAPAATGEVALRLEIARGRTLDHATVALAVKRADENRRVTFTSDLDGSVQAFGLRPPLPGPATRAGEDLALVLSLHGANVDALNQSGSYPPLPWAWVIAPTNRRPYGFNWEDWGRRDALEVLDLALATLPVDSARVHLTGHSMGGHGSWHLGTLHPGRFATVAPSAGWISFWSYRPERDATATSPLAAMLARATLPSRTLRQARNLDGLGVYVLHGADDQVVSVAEARTMRDHLAAFHRDLDGHEEPGAGHWWDRDDAPGADCVAWPPLLDFLARHRRPAPHEVRHVAFRTPSPGTSDRRAWVRITGQHRAFVASEVDLRLEPVDGRLRGTTGNVSRLALDVAHVAADTLRAVVDGDTLTVPLAPSGDGPRVVHLARPDSTDAWRAAGPPDPARKGPHRDSGLRTVFDRRVQLIYGTRGSPAENAWALARARHDAEHLWYQGNASVDVLPDTLFCPDAEPDRNVILYGNADTHAHWDALWAVAGVHPDRAGLRLGDRTVTGDGVGLLAIGPRPGSDVASVAVIGGSGLPGCRLTDRRPYLQPGVAYPDVTVLRDRDGPVPRATAAPAPVVQTAGFLDRDWSLVGAELIRGDTAP